MKLCASGDVPFPTYHHQWNSLFVWIVSAMTVTKVVGGCVYIRRRYYGILLRVGGEFEHSALSPLSLRSLSLALSSNATTLKHLIRLRGSQGIQIWKQRTLPNLRRVISGYQHPAKSSLSRTHCQLPVCLTVRIWVTNNALPCALNGITCNKSMNTISW